MGMRWNAPCGVSDVRLMMSRSPRILDTKTALYGERVVCVMTRGYQGIIRENQRGFDRAIHTP